MGTFAGDYLIDEVAIRLRDSANTVSVTATMVPPYEAVSNFAHSRVLILQVLNSCQAAINMRLNLVQSSTTFVTNAYALYNLATIDPNAGRISTIRDSHGRDLQRQPWANLVRSDERWWRTFAPRAEQWAQIGRELVVITPIPLVPETLTVVSVKITDGMTDSGASFMELPDEYKPALIDLAESVLLFRSRDFNPMFKAMERAATRLGAEDILSNARRGTNTPEPSSGGS